MIALVLFWVSLAVAVYTWLGYPFLLAMIARRRRVHAPAGAVRPSQPPHLGVSVIVAAFNEASCIEEKLRSTLADHDHRLEVIVVSDGSTDGTDELVARCPDRRVRLLRQEQRAGKSVALNRAVAVARGDLLIFTDANALFVPGAIARLAAPFADPRVGLVSGQGLYVGADGADAGTVSNGYARYEASTRAGESALGFLASADGAIYALRRRLYADLDAAEVNDLLHPIQAAIVGYESRFDPLACTLEPPSSGGSQEWGRHVRIIAQGIHIVRRWLPRLCAARRWRAVWLLVSHRPLRWASAPVLLTLLATNVAIAARHPIYAIALGAQGLFYAVALAGWLAERRGLAVGRLSVPYYFCLVSAAGVAGLLRFMRGGAQAVWAPTGQTTTGRTRATERAA